MVSEVIRGFDAMKNFHEKVNVGQRCRFDDAVDAAVYAMDSKECICC